MMRCSYLSVWLELSKVYHYVRIFTTNAEEENGGGKSSKVGMRGERAWFRKVGLGTISRERMHV